MQIADGGGFGVRISEARWTRPRAEVGARLVPFVIVFAAILLRAAPMLARYPLHRDEALYGAWAQLIASGTDPLLLTAWVDKPPLVIYLLAASIHLLGPSVLALRLPGMIAGLISVALVYGLTTRLYDSWRPATLAAALFAVSPFAILFAPTAFTDPWLTVWLLAAAWAAAADRPFWSGLLIGLAVASKQQGVLAAALPLALLALQSTRDIGPKVRGKNLSRFFVRRFLPALAGFAVIFIPLTYWDSLRWAKRPSFWDRSLTTYGGLRLAGPLEWLPRLVAWIGQARYLYGAWPVTGLILAFSLLPGVLAVRQNRALSAQRLSYAQRVDLLLLAYVLCYLSLHVFVTFQPWDRYLLPILPLVAILAARGLIAAYRKLSPEGKRLDLRLPLTIGTTTLLAWGAWMGVSGRLPVGSDHGAFENLEKVISFAQARPSDALIYQHSLGWYFDFYLFDAPQERPWWDNSWKLAELASRAANASADREQWLVLTEWEDPIVEGIPAALAGWGLTLREEQVVYRRDQTPAFTIYRIVGSKERSYP